MMPLFNVDIFDKATVCVVLSLLPKQGQKRAWMDFKSNYKIAIFFQLAIRVINQNYPFRIFAEKKPGYIFLVTFFAYILPQ